MASTILLCLGQNAGAVRNVARSELAQLESGSAPEAASLPALRAIRNRCVEVMHRAGLFVPGDKGSMPADSILWDPEDQGVEGWATPCAQLPHGGLVVVGGVGKREADVMRVVVVDSRDKVQMQRSLPKGPYSFLERPCVLALDGGDYLLMLGNAAPAGGADDGAPWILRLDHSGKTRWDLKLPDHHPQGTLRDRGFVLEGARLRVLGDLEKQISNQGNWIRLWTWTGWVDLSTGKLVCDSLGLEPVKP
jgi:hypothetical protein